MERIKKLVISFLMLFFSLLICFSIGEIYLRILYTIEHNRLILKYKDRDKNRELCTAASNIPGLVYTFIPNKCGCNRHGYYDYEYSYTKDDRVYRIIIIGDSIAQGQGVKLEESFGKVLEKKLNNLLKSKKYKIEVIILALSGYSTSQELILLKKEALCYSPNLIIWSYVLNDPAHPIYHNANGELGRYFFKPKIHTISFILKKLFEIKEKIKSKNCDKEYHKLLHCVYWDQIESNINQIGHISEKNNVPIIFLIHPVFEKNKDFNIYSLNLLHKKLSKAASKSGLIVLDLLDAYKAYNPDEIKLHNKKWYDPWHPNVKGHMIVAEYIYNNIDRKEYIKEWIIEND